jgi:hypothetical protein
MTFNSINYLVVHLALDLFYGEVTPEGPLAATLASAHLYEFLV